MIKAEFLASLLQSSVSHDPSEIILICWFAPQETFIIIIINVENNCAASYLCGNRDTFFLQDFLKNSIYFKYKSFVTNIFTVTLLFNASLLNKSNNFYDWLQSSER